MTMLEQDQTSSQARPSRLEQAIAAGEPVLTAELTPPRGGNTQRALQAAEVLRGRVHAVNVTDSSRAVMGMSSLAVCRLLLDHGLEPVFQLCCRDRNRIALQADMLGAHALGIRNVLCLTGDPVKAGDQPEARSVFDYESVRLLQEVQRCNSGCDSVGQPLPDGATCLFPGCVANPQSSSWSGLGKRLQRKQQAGARFVQTQMVTDAQALKRFCNELAQPLGLPVLAGVFLLKSARNAAFINRVVPGACIPRSTIDRLATAADPREEGIRLAAEQVEQYLELAQGVHLMAVKEETAIPDILDQAGIHPVSDGFSPVLSRPPKSPARAGGDSPTLPKVPVRSLVATPR